MPSSKWLEREWLVAAASFIACVVAALGDLSQPVQLTGMVCGTIIAVSYIYSRTRIKQD